MNISLNWFDNHYISFGWFLGIIISLLSDILLFGVWGLLVLLLLPIALIIFIDERKNVNDSPVTTQGVKNE